MYTIVPTAQQICYLPFITIILRYVVIKKCSSQFCDRNVLKNTILKKAGNAPTVFAKYRAHRSCFCNERLRVCTCVHDQRRDAAKARDVPRDEAKIIPVPAAALSGIRPRLQKKYPAAAARQIIRSGA